MNTKEDITILHLFYVCPFFGRGCGMANSGKGHIHIDLKSLKSDKQITFFCKGREENISNTAFPSININILFESRYLH